MEPGSNKGGVTANERGNARRWSNTKLLRKGIASDEADPTTYAEGLNPGEFHGTMWAALKPPLVTSYTLRLWKLIAVYTPNGTAKVEEWVMEAEYTGLTASTVQYQTNDGCRLFAQIDTIVVGGGIGDGFSITHTGVNRHL